MTQGTIRVNTNKTASAPSTMMLVGGSHSRLIFPSQIPNLAVWYAADNGPCYDSGCQYLVPKNKNNAVVLGWRDLSGSNFHLTQNTGGGALQIANAKNNLPGIQMSSQSQQALFTTLQGATLAAPCTILTAMRANSDTGYEGLVLGSVVSGGSSTAGIRVYNTPTHEVDLSLNGGSSFMNFTASGRDNLWAFEVTQASTPQVAIITSGLTFSALTDGTAITVECIGAGGGGGSASNGPGGGGGEYRKSVLSYASGAAIPIQVGQGGSAGTGGSTNGGNGTSTSFGSSVIANGGQGGGLGSAGGSSGTGMTWFNGGNGTSTQFTLGGGGGGGSGGPHGPGGSGGLGGVGNTGDLSGGGGNGGGSSGGAYQGTAGGNGGNTWEVIEQKADVAADAWMPVFARVFAAEPAAAPEGAAVNMADLLAGLARDRNAARVLARPPAVADIRERFEVEADDEHNEEVRRRRALDGAPVEPRAMRRRSEYDNIRAPATTNWPRRLPARWPRW